MGETYIAFFNDFGSLIGLEKESDLEEAFDNWRKSSPAKKFEIQALHTMTELQDLLAKKRNGRIKTRDFIDQLSI